MAAPADPPAKQGRTSAEAVLELGPSFGQKRFLEAAHPQARDSRIVFDDTWKWNPKTKEMEQRHEYYVQWKEGGPFDNHGVTSVTTFVHEFFPKFDPDKVIAKMRASKSWVRSKYRGMSDVEIKDQWKQNGLDARTNGSKLHNCIEMFFNGELGPGKDKPHTADWLQFEKFAEDHNHLKPFRTEWFVFSDDDTRISGSVDMTFISPMHIFPDSRPSEEEREEKKTQDEEEEIRKEDGTAAKKERILWIDIWDWKRSKRIRSYNPWEKGFAPLDDLPNANFYQYAMQLNFYKWMVETFIRDVVFDGIHYDRIHVNRMYIVVFHPENKRYIIKQMPDFQERVKTMIEKRKWQLKGEREKNHMTDLVRTSMREMAEKVFQEFESTIPNRPWSTLEELERACCQTVQASHPAEWKALQDWQKLNPKDEFLHILCLVSLHQRSMRPVPVFEPPQTKPPLKRAPIKPNKEEEKKPADTTGKMKCDKCKKWKTDTKVEGKDLRICHGCERHDWAVREEPSSEAASKSTPKTGPKLVPSNRWEEVAAQLATLDPRRPVEFVSLGPVTKTLKQLKPEND